MKTNHIFHCLIVCVHYFPYLFYLQTLSTVEEDANGERIENQLVTLKEQLFELSATEQQLNSAPISERLAVSVEVRPQPALCNASNTYIQTTLQVTKLKKT